MCKRSMKTGYIAILLAVYFFECNPMEGNTPSNTITTKIKLQYCKANDVAALMTSIPNNIQITVDTDNELSIQGSVEDVKKTKTFIKKYVDTSTPSNTPLYIYPE